MYRKRDGVQVKIFFTKISFFFFLFSAIQKTNKEIKIKEHKKKQGRKISVEFVIAIGANFIELKKYKEEKWPIVPKFLNKEF